MACKPRARAPIQRTMALVLKRSTGESVLFTTESGERMEVKISSVDGFGQVRLVIDAPKSVLISRAELDRG
jgi:carbon storage regulator